MADVALKSEKESMKALIKYYKDMPCLWKPSHRHYGAKAVRNKHYNELLEKYRLHKPKADLNQLKRKIEYMRSSFNREHRKVAGNRIRGEERTPTLWYYKLLRFLVEDEDNSIPEYLEDEDTKDGSILKKCLTTGLPGMSTPENTDTSNVIYLEDHLYETSYSLNMDGPNENRQGTSADAFGRTIGMQLAELHPSQRFVAEKLISDIIYIGRLEKLTPESQLDISSRNNDDENVPS